MEVVTMQSEAYLAIIGKIEATSYIKGKRTKRKMVRQPRIDAVTKSIKAHSASVQRYRRYFILSSR